MFLLWHHYYYSQDDDSPQFDPRFVASEFYQSSFMKWRDWVLLGFNLMFYGIGSKVETVEDFASILQRDAPVLVITGYTHISGFAEKFPRHLCSALRLQSAVI